MSNREVTKSPLRPDSAGKSNWFPISKALVLLSFILSTIGFIGFAKDIKFLPENPVRQVANTSISLWESASLEHPRCRSLYRHLVEKSLEKPEAVFWQDVFALGKNGELYPVRAVFLSVLGAPFYGLLGESGFWLLNQIFLLVILYSLYSLHLVRDNHRNSALVALVAIVGTQLIHFSYSFSYDLFACCLIVAGLALSYRKPFVGALLLSLSIETRPTNILFLPLLLAPLLATAEKRRILLLLIFGAASGLLLVLSTNYYLWGDPFSAGFERMLRFQNGQPFIAGNDPSPNLETLLEDWWKKLFDRNVGMLWPNPILLLLPLAVIRLVRGSRDRLLLVCLFVAGLHYLLIYSFPSWGANANGTRYLLTANALLGFTVAALLFKRLGKGN